MNVNFNNFIKKVDDAITGPANIDSQRGTDPNNPFKLTQLTNRLAEQKVLQQLANETAKSVAHQVISSQENATDTAKKLGKRDFKDIIANLRTQLKSTQKASGKLSRLNSNPKAGTRITDPSDSTLEEITEEFPEEAVTSPKTILGTAKGRKGSVKQAPKTGSNASAPTSNASTPLQTSAPGAVVSADGSLVEEGVPNIITPPLTAPNLEDLNSDTQLLANAMKGLPPGIFDEMLAEGDPDLLFAKNSVLQNLNSILFSNFPNKKDLISEFIRFGQIADPSFQDLKNILSQKFPSPVVHWIVSGLESGLIDMSQASVSAQNLVQSVVNNYNAIKDVVGDHKGLEVAFYFAEVAPNQIISPIQSKMSELINQISKNVVDAKKDLAAFPLGAEEFDECIQKYAAAKGTVEKSLKMAQVVVPEFSDKEIVADMLTDTDLKMLTQTHTAINQNMASLNGLQSQIFKANPDQLEALIASYQMERKKVTRDLDKVKRTLPGFDSHSASKQMLSDNELNKILTINLMVMEQYTPQSKAPPPIKEAREAAMNIAKVERYFVGGLYSPKEHEDFYKKAWAHLEESLSKAKDLDATFMPESITNTLLPKLSVISLETRTHDIKIEKAISKLDELGATSGNWILLFNEASDELEKAVRSAKGDLIAAITSTEGLRPLIPDMVHGLKH